jgi:hypothetical protein
MKNALLSSGRRAIAIVLGATLLLSLAAPAAAADPMRPFLGIDKGTSTIGQPIAACPAASMFYVQDTGTGYFAYIGRVNYTLDQCAAVDFSTGQGWTTRNGSMTIIAAHGDRLVLSYRMRFLATPMPVPTTANAHIDWVAAGGTGRFVSARGSGKASFNINYTPDLTGGATSSVWWGWISY